MARKNKRTKKYHDSVDFYDEVYTPTYKQIQPRNDQQRIYQDT